MPDKKQSNYNLIQVNTKPQYNIHIGSNIIYSNFLIKELTSIHAKGYNHFVIIIDQVLSGQFEKLNDFISKNLAVNISQINISINESLKTRETKSKIEDKLFEVGANRYTAIIAIGGGVLLDTVGFVAATFNRGVPVVYIATTLLSMVDAAVGGKTGVNTQYGKNLIGAFKQPNTVLIDITVLNSLPEHDYLSAISEIIKVAIIKDKALFYYLFDKKDKILARDHECLTNLITTSIDIKRKIVEQDEHESNLRQILNFGHTLGHAIEKLEEYKLSHGYAVALGLWSEVNLAYKIQILNKADYIKIINLVEGYFKNKIKLFTKDIDIEQLYYLLGFDKKTKDKQAYFVLVDKIGSYFNKDNKCSHTADKDNVLEVMAMLNQCCLISTD